MDALLLNFPDRQSSSPLEEVGSVMTEHLGLGYLAAVLRKNNYQVEILDANILRLSPSTTIEEIKKRTFKVLGISLFYNKDAQENMELIGRLREEGVDTHITVGGHFATFDYQELLTHVQVIDSVIRGEGEYTFLELVRKIDQNKDWRDVPGLAYRKDGEVVANPLRPTIACLDDLPFPARDTFPLYVKRRFPATISTSRGCYANCSFCSINQFYDYSPGAKWRTRSAKNVIDEMESLSSAWGARRWLIVDDNLIGAGKAGKEHARQMALEIIKRDLDFDLYISCRANDVDEDLFTLLKQAGLKEALVGAESSIPRTLKLLNKGVTLEHNRKAIETLQKLGIRPNIGFITFDPFCTFDEVRQNFSFLKEAGLFSSLEDVVRLVSHLVVFKGAPIMKTLEKEGVLEGSTYLSYMVEYRFLDPRVKAFHDILRMCFEKMGRARLEILSPLISKIPDSQIMRARKATDGFLLNIFATIFEEASSSLEKGEMEEKRALEFFEERVDSAIGRIKEDMSNYGVGHYM